MDGNSGYLSHSLYPLYFGLGAAETVDGIEVRGRRGRSRRSGADQDEFDDRGARAVTSKRKPREIPRRFSWPSDGFSRSIVRTPRVPPVRSAARRARRSAGSGGSNVLRFAVDRASQVVDSP